MKITILGATGMAGSRIVDEALTRGHDVRALARNIDRIAPQDRLTPVVADVLSPDAAELAKGGDVLVSAIHFTDVPGERIIAFARRVEASRLVVVGGAGSLQVAPGLQLVDSPSFPESYRPEARAGRDFLNLLERQKDLEWTFLSPPALFRPGERTGQFRLGRDELLVAADGQSHISAEDYAIALLDEVEKPKHRRQRFSVGY